MLIYLLLRYNQLKSNLPVRVNLTSKFFFAPLFGIALTPDFLVSVLKPLKKKEPIKLMVVDDHPAFRMGLITLIQTQEDMVVVAESEDACNVVEVFSQTEPDVVLMDLRLPGLGGVEAIIALRKEFPECRVIVITTYDCDEDIYRACQSGAKSYLLKDMSKEEIVGMIRTVYAGQYQLPSVVADRLSERLKRGGLRKREMEVLEALVKGRSNKEIAASLFISEDTVKSHLKTLYARLDVQDRTEAVIAAIRHGIIHLE
jgi:DNA-binding NarL/FixJ family response regulator